MGGGGEKVIRIKIQRKTHGAKSFREQNQHTRELISVRNT